MEKMRFVSLVLSLIFFAGISLAGTNEPAATPPPAHRGVAALTAPVRTVYTNYLNIQAALADDSLAGVAANAKAIADAIRKDADKALSADTAAEADAVAGAKDLAEAREALKPLSDSLIKYLADHEVRVGSYVQIYCPMAEANWLQTAGEDTANPYFGKSMRSCGTPKQTF